MQKITPCLWFDTNAEDAVAYYLSIFNDGKVLDTVRYPKAGHEIHGMEEGSVMTIDFEIEGFTMTALNGGPHFKITPAISLRVNCPTREEVDELWEKLSEGGSALMPLDAYPFSERYGWIKDKYGLSWQLMYTEGIEKRTIFPSLLYVGKQAGKAEEAMNKYIATFKNSSAGNIARYGAGQEPDAEGSVMYADCILAGQKFAVMDSAHAHEFTFNEGLSLIVTCDTQEEIDEVWNALSAHPEAEMCGWLKDAYGVSWQITPSHMNEILNNPDREKAERGMQAMMQMKKIDMEALKAAIA